MFDVRGQPGYLQVAVVVCSSCRFSLNLSVRVPLTWGPTLGWLVVIGHGLSFEVSVFGRWLAPGPVAELLEPGAVVSDPPADRVVGKEPAGVGPLAD
jgi:hypothetical protein